MKILFVPLFFIYSVVIFFDAQLRNNYRMYSELVKIDYNEYCEKMAKSGEYGEDTTLHAIADMVRFLCLNIHSN